ncbi:hypothetical protein G6F48_013675 [Rhizopus delemar]|nr:hypothetical protein G6F48_013675 [Rhizopus delemar]
MSRRDVRSRLSVLGIDPYRVLDITFPARSVVGLLVHEQYKDVLLAQLGKAKIDIYKDFNPCDPAHLADPTYSGYQNRSHKTVQTLGFLMKYKMSPYAHPNSYYGESKLKGTFERFWGHIF